MLFLLLQLQVQSPSILAARADTIRPAHDALHYDVTLVTGDTGTHVLAEVQTTWRLHSDEPVEMELDSAMRVVRVLVDSKENTRLSRTMYARSATVVDVPHQKHAGDTVTTRVRYHGFIRDGLIVRKNQYGDRTIFADNWPDRAHLWLASQDEPSDKATVAFHVQAPVNSNVIANGVLGTIDTLAYGHAVWNYTLDRPIPVYSMVVGIGQFARAALPNAGCAIHCVPLSVWTYPRDSAYAVTGPFRRAGDMVDYFSRPVRAVPLSIAGARGVEHPVRRNGKRHGDLLRREALCDQDAERGDCGARDGPPMVRRRRHRGRLAPSLVVGRLRDLPICALGTARRGGQHFSDDDAGGGRNGIQLPGDRASHRGHAARDLMGLLNSNNYQKGAWVLHQLRGLIGDSAFFGGMRRYYTTFRDSTALSADFARVMSQAAGRDLDWYFRQALTQPGYPVLDVRWKHKGRSLTLDIAQTQKPEWGTYRIPLIVLVDDQPARVEVNGPRAA